MLAGAIPLEAQSASRPGAEPVAHPAAGDTLALTLSDAIGRAFRFGDEARAADATVDLADAQVGVARSSALPQLRLANTS